MAAEHPSIVGMNEPTIGYHLSPFLSNEPGYHAEDLDLEHVHDSPGAGGRSGEVLRREVRRRLGSRPAATAQRPPPRPPGARSRRAGRRRSHAAGQGAQRLPVGGRDHARAAHGSAPVPAPRRPRRRRLRARVVSPSAAGRSGPSPTCAGSPRRSDSTFVVNSAYQWLWRTEVVEAAFAEHRGPKHMLRYEDLVGEPGAAARASCSSGSAGRSSDGDVAAIVDRFEPSSDSRPAAPISRTASRHPGPGARTCGPKSGPRVEASPGREAGGARLRLD